MIVNPFEYSSIANGTIHLGTAKTSDSQKNEDEDKKVANETKSDDEDSYTDVDFSTSIDDTIDSLGQTQESIISAIKSMISSATSSVASISPVSTSSNSSITPVSGDFANKLNDKFKGALAGKGDVIVGAAEKYGIDPALLAAIMALETGWGTSSAVNNQNNPGGLMDPASNWMKLKSYSSIEEGIDAMAKNLKTGYIDQGLTTISQIGNKYCPVGAANDPNGTNSGWIPSVTSIYNQLKA